MRNRLLACTLLALAALAPQAAQAASTWRLEQPAPPPGARFKVPLGAPGDLDFYAPNRGLLSVEGNGAIPRGLFFYDGVEWRQLSTVCGGTGDTSRIAWAGPDEFWVVTEPSRPRAGAGLGLCRFKGGAVVASYSTADSAPDPYRQMVSAACNGPDDCWFGGVGSQDATGQRVGAFHLRWDGTDLRTVYDPQGRGVSDLEWVGDRFLSTRFVGRRAGDRTTPVDLATPEPFGPRILRNIRPAGFGNEPFVFVGDPALPSESTELLAADSDGEDTWAVGGGAASGPAAPQDGQVARPPAAIRAFGGGWQELALDPAPFAADESFVDVAAMPGSGDALAASTPFAERRQTTVKARVVTLRPDGSSELVRLPASGSGRGAAARVACPAPGDCWMVTVAGWLFHYTDGRVYERTTDPAFAKRIDARPNEAAEQFVPDAPPVDDSQLFAPPPAEAVQPVAPAEPVVVKRKPLLQRVRSRITKKLVLVVSFRLTRRARIGLVATRKGRIVGRVKVRRLAPGARALRLKVTRKRYPTGLRFVLPDEPKPAPEAQDEGETITTGGGDVVTTG